MNANEFKLRILTQEIQHYEQENTAVKDYLKLKQEREVILNDISHNW